MEEPENQYDDLPEMPEKRFWQKRFFIVSVIVGFFTFLFLFFSFEAYLPHSALDGSKQVEVPPQYGSRKIGELLKNEGAIRSKWVFVAYVSLRGWASSLQPGEYTFSNRDSVADIARQLIRGGTNEVAITIPEGWTIYDIAEALEENRVVTKDEFLLFRPSTELKNKFPFLEEIPADTVPEGYFFPDTYRFFKNAELDDVVSKMLANFDRKITPDLREEIKKQNKTLFDIITIASLIEKEVVTDEDRAIVSGILWKRLEHNIAMQVDATLSYIKKQRGEEPSRDGRLFIRDTKVDSPYNTYLYPGLPKGPIANPGLSAIRAAMYPKNSPYLYYLSAQDGTTIFSKTLNEHNVAKAKYLQRPLTDF